MDGIAGKFVSDQPLGLFDLPNLAKLHLQTHRTSRPSVLALKVHAHNGNSDTAAGAISAWPATNTSSATANPATFPRRSGENGPVI